MSALSVEAMQSRIKELEAKVEAAKALADKWRIEGEGRHKADDIGSDYIVYSVIAGCAAALSEALEAK